jgi:hypothetical protein
MTIALPDGARFAATLGAPVFWNPADPSEGPEGAWLNSSWLKGHWFISSTASTVQWSLTSAGQAAKNILLGFPNSRDITAGNGALSASVFA